MTNNLIESQKTSSIKMAFNGRSAEIFEHLGEDAKSQSQSFHVE